MKKTILLGFTILCLCCVLLSVSISLPVEIHAYGEDSQLHNSSNDEITATNNNESDDEKTDIGIQIDKIGIENFTNIKYIENADYFKANPRHKRNDGSDNRKGTCTTVAMQLLMGYHNYYTDRRIIPEFNENGKRFLAENYVNKAYLWYRNIKEVKRNEKDDDESDVRSDAVCDDIRNGDNGRLCEEHDGGAAY